MLAECDIWHLATGNKKGALNEFRAPFLSGKDQFCQAKIRSALNDAQLLCLLGQHALGDLV
ncbi:hypothetical protein, partial [Pseudomonas syringae group genomosp. 3]|uniref:hypothetical protein n=1 Tax=Pseudomonas syringae group genomosp. 3 TaxID=251701 RepID=UPI001C9DCB82